MLTSQVSTLDCPNVRYRYEFKTIPSYMFHKSPTADELINQIKNPIAPNLPIDRDRYVDFIGPGTRYKRIDYPNLFRIKLPLA
jgi:hypothetical protein